MAGIKIFRIDSNEGSMMEDVRHIRREVFVKEQNVPEEHEWDDAIAEHYILYFDTKAVATLRLRIIERKIKIERFAVLKEYRGKHFGEKILKFAIEDIENKSISIYLNSQVHAMGFYKKYGFEPCGDLFYEANIPHYAMIYKNN